MLKSWRIGTAFGIGIYVHWSFLLLPLWVLLAQSGTVGFDGALFLVALVMAMFGCVVLHELGHAMAARIFGIRTRDITLYPIGGVARLESTGHSPWQEVAVAIAGPAVNVVIAFGLAFLLALELLTGFQESLAFRFTLMLLALNVGMVLFNMLPAFPMDGGRVLRALLSLRLGRLRATRFAAWLTTVLALVGLVVGVYIQSPWLPVIAVFIWFGAQQELRAVEWRAQSQRVEAQPRADEPAGFDGAWPGFAYRPQVAVYVWDGEAGVWVLQRNAPVRQE